MYVLKASFLGARSIFFMHVLQKSYYTEGMKGLEERWIECIELKWDYIEK